MYRLMKESYSGKSKPRGDGDQGYEKGVFKADGATLTANAAETRTRWFEYTKELFNTPVSLTPYRQLRIDHEGECVDGEIIPMEDLLPPPRPTGPLHSYDSAFTTREQTDARKRSPDNRQTGPDQIPHEILKYAMGPIFTALQLKNVNEAFSRQLQVEAWQRGVMLFLYKRDDPRLPANHRGLTLTNHEAKEVERMIYIRLLRFCAETDCLRQEEFAFLPGKSTVDAIFINRLLSSWAKERGCKLYKCYIDLHKAYDRVHRPTLWLLLERLGVPPKLLSLIRNLYDHTRIQIRCLGELSEPLSMENGLIQGGVLPPLLFNIYVAAIINAAHREYSKCGITTGIRLVCRTTGRYFDLPQTGDHTEMIVNIAEILYCDDWILLADSEQSLQVMVTIIDRMVKAFGQQLSPSKSSVLASDLPNAPHPPRPPPTHPSR